MKPDGLTEAGFGIPMTDQEVKLENQRFAQFSIISAIRIRPSTPTEEGHSPQNS
jgi:hypothetical protein